KLPDYPITQFKLLLASASPRRAELLRSAGYAFDVRAVEVDERARPREDPVEYVCRLACEKSERALDLVDDETFVVLAADTAVVVGHEILGKPRDDRDAEVMLKKLSGAEHEVLTGVSLRTQRTELDAVERTRVWFEPLTVAEIAWYLASGEGRDKAGAY